MSEAIPRTSLLCLAIVVLLLPACDSGPTNEGNASVVGTWTGRASGVEIADFTMTLTQNASNVTGTGNVFFPGDQNRFSFNVTGSLTGSNVSLTVQLPAQPSITYVAVLAGQTISGVLNGGNIQHDGPFTNTALTLIRQ